MITVDQINKMLDKADKIAYTTEIPEHNLAYLLGKALVYAIIYAAETIAKQLRNLRP